MIVSMQCMIFAIIAIICCMSVHTHATIASGNTNNGNGNGGGNNGNNGNGNNNGNPANGNGNTTPPPAQSPVPAPPPPPPAPPGASVPPVPPAAIAATFQSIWSQGFELPASAVQCYDRLNAIHAPLTAHTLFSQLTSSAYVDHISEPANREYSERLLSNLFFQQPECDFAGNVNQRLTTQLETAILQWYTHESTAMFLESEMAGFPVEPLTMVVPPEDPDFSPPGFVLTSSRALPSADFPSLTPSPRQHPNAVSGFLDGDSIFGDRIKQQSLRTFSGGRLRASNGGFLTWNNQSIIQQSADAGAYPAYLVNDAGIGNIYVAGDKRVKENIQLTAVATIWFRFFNILAEEYQQTHPTASDEEIFNNAAAAIAAYIQVVLYQEVLPEVVGPANTVSLAVPPQLKNESQRVGILKDFAAAAFRTIHSLPTCTFPSINASGVLTNLSFGASLTNMEGRFQAGGFDDIVRGMVEVAAARNDRFVVTTLRSLNVTGLVRDLPATDMARFQEVGGASINAIRAALGLPLVTSWNNISTDKYITSTLTELYGQNYTHAPAFLLMMVEDDKPDSQLGPTATDILVRQYSDLREMDPCHYEYLYPPALIQAFQATSFADIMSVTTDVALTHNPFHLRDIGIAGVPLPPAPAPPANNAANPPPTNSNPNNNGGGRRPPS